MKLSDNTISVLKNFSTINQSLLFKTGNVIKTLSVLKTVFAEVTVDENFDKDFALYDLNKLLAKLSLYKDADIALESDRLIVSTDNKKKSDYIKYCSPQTIVSPPNYKSVSINSVDCSFKLEKEDLDWMRRSAGISSSPHFVFESDGQKILFTATDVDDDSADQSKIELGTATSRNKFRVVLKVENIKLIDGSYNVEVSKKGVAKFTHTQLPLHYVIAIESKSSTFEEVDEE
jgi:hypothetical protein